MEPIAVIRLAPGEVGFYDELTRIHLTIADPQKPVTKGMNVAGLRRSVKSKRLLLVSGSLEPETASPIPAPAAIIARPVAVVQEQPAIPVVEIEPELVQAPVPEVIVETPVEKPVVETETEVVESVDEVAMDTVVEAAPPVESDVTETPAKTNKKSGKSNGK